MKVAPACPNAGGAADGTDGFCAGATLDFTPNILEEAVFCAAFPNWNKLLLAEVVAATPALGEGATWPNMPVDVEVMAGLLLCPNAKPPVDAAAGAATGTLAVVAAPKAGALEALPNAKPAGAVAVLVSVALAAGNWEEPKFIAAVDTGSCVAGVASTAPLEVTTGLTPPNANGAELLLSAPPNVMVLVPVTAATGVIAPTVMLPAGMVTPGLMAPMPPLSTPVPIPLGIVRPLPMAVGAGPDNVVVNDKGVWAATRLVLLGEVATAFCPKEKPAAIGAARLDSTILLLAGVAGFPASRPPLTVAPTVGATLLTPDTPCPNALAIWPLKPPMLC